MIGAGDRVLVTGGTGFIGQHLVRTLLRGGATVRTGGRHARPDDLPGEVEYHQLDLATGDHAPWLDGVRTVFHTAGASSSIADGPEMERTNEFGTDRLLDAAMAAGVERVVHLSTSSVYGKEVALEQPVTETTECHPGGDYARSKWLAEQVAWRWVDKGLDVTVLRPVTVYGPGAVKLVASTILDAAIERYAGLEVLAVPAEAVELRLVHVDDVVAACRHLSEHPEAPGRAFNLASGVYPSSHDVARAVTDGLGMALEPVAGDDIGLDHDRRRELHERMVAQGMVDRIMLKSQRIRFLRKANPNNRLSLEALASIGFRPQHTDVTAGITDSVQWYRDQRWII